MGEREEVVGVAREEVRRVCAWEEKEGGKEEEEEVMVVVERMAEHIVGKRRTRIRDHWWCVTFTR